MHILPETFTLHDVHDTTTIVITAVFNSALGAQGKAEYWNLEGEVGETVNKLFDKFKSRLAWGNVNEDCRFEFS